MNGFRPPPSPESDPPDARDLSAMVDATRGLQPWRRVFHAVSGVTLALAPPALDLSRVWTVGLLLAALAVALGLDLARLRSARVNRLFFRWFRVLASPREAGGMASSTWYLVGAALAWGLYPAPFASAGILVLALADPAAGVVGRLWGRRRLGQGSVEGSLAFLATGLAVLYPAMGTLLVIPVALAVTLLEVVPGIGDDNLVIPLATGGLLWIVLGSPTSLPLYP